MDKESYGNLTFVKLKAPPKVLKKYCEIMKFRMPIRETSKFAVKMSTPSIKGFSLFDEIVGLLKKVGNFLTRGDLDDTSNKFEYKSTYSRNKEYLFNEDDPDFFSYTIRILIVHHILNSQTLNCDDGSEDEPVSLENLLKDGVYKAAYPLHDGDCKDDASTRANLLRNWANMKNFYRKQPIDVVQEYLGTKIAFYFAWLGFYTRLLLPPAFVGSLVMIYGLLTLPDDEVSRDTCNASNITMCPTCDYNCDYYELSDNCLYSKIVHIFDNNLNVIFALLMAVWASTFLEMWKRYDAVLNYRWSLNRFSEEEEPSRPEFLAKVVQYDSYKKNIVTGKKDPAVPFWRVRFPVALLSYTTTLFFIMLVVIAVISVLVYRMWITTAISKSTDEMSILKTYGSAIIVFTGPALNLITIMILDKVYASVAAYLTELELHRTRTEHETALHMKIYMFEFVNYYSSIMYIAFFKGKFTGYPEHYWKLFGSRQEECNYGGCMLELSVQLAFIMIGKQIFGAIYQPIAAFLKHIYKVYVSKKEAADNQSSERELLNLTGDASQKRWIEDYKLADWETVGLFPEYLKIVVQFGFITLFVPAFPIAPLFALISNILEIRFDALKIVTFYRKPIPYRVPGIGIWFNVLQFLGSFAVLTNAIVIAFSSSFVPRLVYMLNNNWSDDNFLMNTLSQMNVNDMENASKPFNSTYSNVTLCMYKDMRQPASSPDKYTPTSLYWQVFLARLIFIVLFQNITYAIKSLIDYWVPDEPEEILQLIKRENYLTTQLIIQRETELVANSNGINGNGRGSVSSVENSPHFSRVSTLRKSFEEGIDKMVSSKNT
ncbi:anoctamin-2-like isoform X2 [Planococcus citri]